MIRPDRLTSATRFVLRPSARRFLHNNAKGPLQDLYVQLTQASGFDQDPIQLRALQSLERLYADLERNVPPSDDASVLTGWMAKPSWMNTADPSTSTRIRGVYLHGGVGCGKTFLMNQVFHDAIKDGPWKAERQKTHFNKFMLRVHQEMHSARSHAQGEELIQVVVDKIVQKGRLLCFDEFQVTDVADAMILQQLFGKLWKAGCVVVATSNRPPDDLYLNGLQRDRFIPFIGLLKEKCEVMSMWESEKDYRLVMKRQSSSSIPQKVYFQGDKSALREFDALFYHMAGSVAVAPTALSTQGRKVLIPQAALAQGIARFTFEELCQKALGAADYLVIGQQFHTVFVQGIPVLTLNHLNWVRRFITFVDSMYECQCKIILHAKTDISDIFQPGAKTQDDEVFAFDRTVSRLQEMSSQKYLQKQQKTIGAESKAALLSQRKAVVNVIPSLGDAAQQ